MEWHGGREEGREGARQGIGDIRRHGGEGMFGDMGPIRCSSALSCICIVFAALWITSVRLRLKSIKVRGGGQVAGV